MLEGLGWIVIRVIAEDRPVEWLNRVQAALASRGCHLDINVLQAVAWALAA